MSMKKMCMKRFSRTTKPADDRRAVMYPNHYTFQRMMPRMVSAMPKIAAQNQ